MRSQKSRGTLIQSDKRPCKKTEACGEKPCDAETEVGWGVPGAPSAEGRKGVPLPGVSEGAWPCWHLDFARSASRTERRGLSVVLSLLFVVLCHSGSRKVFQRARASCCLLWGPRGQERDRRGQWAGVRGRRELEGAGDWERGGGGRGQGSRRGPILYKVGSGGGLYLTPHPFRLVDGRRHACVLSFSVLPDLWGPMDCSLPGSSVHGILQTRILEWGSHSLLQGIFLHPGNEPGSPALTGGFFTTVPPGKPSWGSGPCPVLCPRVPGPGVHRSGSESPGSSGGEKGMALMGQGCGACVLVARTPNKSSCFQPQLTLEKQLEPLHPERPASAHRCPGLKARSQRSWLPGIPEPSRKGARAPSPGLPKNLRQAPCRSRLAWRDAFLSDASSPHSTFPHNSPQCVSVG